MPIDSFQGFSDEIKSLPYLYDEAHDGVLLLGLELRPDAPFSVVDASSGVELRGDPIACIAFKDLPAAGHGAAEIKRLFVDPEARGRTYGRVMTLRLMEEARRVGYRKLVLDTLERLQPAALKLYRLLGFVEVLPYVHNPMSDVYFLGKEL